MDKEKTIEIVAPEGYEVDKEKSSFEKIVFRALRDELPKTWKDVGEINGWWVDNAEDLKETEELPPKGRDLAIFPSKEEAEASIALAMLCQLRDRYNGGWKPNWDEGSNKYVVYLSRDGIEGTSFSSLPHVLSFKTSELRDKFMENFSDLIEKAKPLLG